MADTRHNKDAHVDKINIPPHSQEAEQSVIGSMLIEPDTWDKVTDIVIEDDFYLASHRTIYSAILKILNANQPVDVITVSEYLEQREQLDEVGGLSYLGNLANNIPSAANVVTYAQIIKERAITRELIGVAHQIAAVGYHPEGRESSEILDLAESKVFEIAEKRTGQSEGPQGIEVVLGKTVERLDQLVKSNKDVTGVSTGFVDLDKKTSGLQPSDLIIVAARPSMGKTTFAMNLAENAMMLEEKPVLVFSLEMPAEQLMMRMLASLSRVNQTSIRTAQLDEEDWSRLSNTMAMLKDKKNLYIDDSSGLTPMDVRSRARKIARENGGVSMIMIDYLQLMRVPALSDNRTLEISEISRSLKALAKELSVPVIALSQLNRTLEQRADKRPINSDLRECVVGSTQVLLSNGYYANIEALVGHTPDVVSSSPKGKIEHAFSDLVWEVGEKAVFEVVTGSGRTITCTEKHQLLSIDGWSRLDQLTPGSPIALPRMIPEPTVCMSMPDHEIIFLGYMIGNGEYDEHQPMRYTTTSEANCDAVEMAALSCGYKVNRREGLSGNGHQLDIAENDNPLHANAAGQWLKDVGIYGQHAHNKHIPRCIFQLNNEQVSLFLRHLVASNGEVSVSGVSFSSASRKLVDDVSLLLMRFGIVSRITHNKAEVGTGCYELAISGKVFISLFIEHVGGFGDHVAPIEELAKALADTQATTNMDTNVETISTAMIDDEPVGHFADTDLYWDNITSITPQGKQPVYDLTVPGNASWIANGIVSHNSGAIEQDADLIMFIYRDEVYHENSEHKGIAEIIIGKQRNGPIGTSQLVFQGQYSRFDNYAGSGVDDQY